MTVSTSAAIAGVAAAASAAAHSARVAQCKTVLPNFNAQEATVSEMKEYAECVETLYPTEISADATVALKVLFVVVLARAAFAIWEYRQGNTDVVGQVLAGLLGLMIAPAALALIVVIALGIKWLFS